MTEPTGFQLWDKKKLIEFNKRMGEKKSPTKGFGSLTPKQRSEAARRAVKIRWDKYRKEQSEAKSNS